MEKLSDYVIVLENVIPEKLCDDIIQKFESDSRKREGLITVNGEAVYDPSYKSSTDLTITGLLDWVEIDNLLYDSAKESLVRYKAILGEDARFLSGNRDEAYIVRRYDTDHNYYHPHADSVSFRTVTRKLAMLWYLNTVDKGGETDFLYFDCKIHPKKGCLGLFPTDWMYAHQGNTPLSNPKYIVRSFLHVSN